MKQSIFKQSITEKGTVKTASGEIVITMNHKMDVMSGTRAVTHDDYFKQVPLHKIEAYVDGILWDSEVKLKSELEVQNTAQLFKERLENHLKKIANTLPEKSFTEKMEELGFINN